PYLGVDRVRSRDPVDGALHGTSAAVAADGGRIVRAADLRDLAIGTQREVGAFDDVRVAQPNFGPGRQPEILLRRDLAKVVALDPQFATERHLARARRGIFGIVDGIHLLDFAFGVVRDDELQRPQHRHAALGAAIEILTETVLEQRELDGVVGLCDADALAEVADAFWCITATPQARQRRHPRIV